MHLIIESYQLAAAIINSVLKSLNQSTRLVKLNGDLGQLKTAARCRLAINYVTKQKHLHRHRLIDRKL